MEIANVSYQKACKACMTSSGFRHSILWNGAEEFYTKGDLIYEKEAKQKIADWHEDSKITCPNCGSIDNWKIWDIEVSGTMVQRKPNPTIFFTIKGVKQPDGQLKAQCGYGEVSNAIMETAFQFFQRQLNVERANGKLIGNVRGSFEMTLLGINEAPWFELGEFDVSGFGYEEIKNILVKLENHYVQ